MKISDWWVYIINDAPWSHQDSLYHQSDHELCKNLQAVSEKYLHVASIAVNHNTKSNNYVSNKLCMTMVVTWNVYCLRATENQDFNSAIDLHSKGNKILAKDAWDSPFPWSKACLWSRFYHGLHSAEYWKLQRILDRGLVHRYIQHHLAVKHIPKKNNLNKQTLAKIGKFQMP